MALAGGRRAVKIMKRSSSLCTDLDTMALERAEPIVKRCASFSHCTDSSSPSGSTEHLVVRLRSLQTLLANQRMQDISSSIDVGSPIIHPTAGVDAVPLMTLPSAMPQTPRLGPKSPHLSPSPMALPRPISGFKRARSFSLSFLGLEIHSSASPNPMT